MLIVFYFIFRRHPPCFTLGASPASSLFGRTEYRVKKSLRLSLSKTLVFAFSSDLTFVELGLTVPGSGPRSVFLRRVSLA
jgi:hypothetical protein